MEITHHAMFQPCAPNHPSALPMEMAVPAASPVIITWAYRSYRGVPICWASAPLNQTKNEAEPKK